MNPITLDIIIPAYNEEANIGPIVKDTYEKCIAQQLLPHLILINDGSSDNTFQEIKAAADSYPNVTVIHHVKRSGVGNALRAGFQETQSEYVTWISADGEVRINQNLGLLGLMQDADMITSSRKREVTLQQLGNPWTRKILTQGMTMLAFFAVGFNFAKYCGAWIIKKSVLDRMMLYSSSGFVNCEIIYYCLYNKLKMRHGMTYFQARLSGSSKVANLKTAFSVINDILSFYFRNKSRQIKIFFKKNTRLQLLEKHKQLKS